MYKKLSAENKKIATLFLLAVFLLSFCISIVFSSIFAVATVDASKADRLFTGDNMKTTPTEGGVVVSAKDNEDETKIDYNAVLALDYARKLTSYDETAETVGIEAPARGQFNLQFSVFNLYSDKIVFEFTDYVDAKKAIRITFDFSNFNATENAVDPDTFDIDVIVAYTENEWKEDVELADTTEIRSANWNAAGNNFFTDADFSPKMLEDIIFEIEFDFNGGRIVLKRSQIQPPDEGSSDPTENYINFGDLNLHLPKSFAGMKFFHNTAKMAVKYEEPREAVGAEVTELIFREINKQTLSNNSETVNQLPIIMPDKKINKPLSATTFGGGYNGLQTSRKAGVTFPIVIADPVNYTVYGYFEVWLLDPNTGALDELIDTKDFTWGTSGISYTFDTVGTYEVRIFAGSLTNVAAVKDAVKIIDSDADNYQRVIAEKINYKVVTDKGVKAPKLEDSTGIQDLQDLIDTTFKTQWQDLPEYQKDFTFPRPDGLFSNGIDEDYTLTFSIGYKHESDNTYQWSDTLDVRISRTGLFKFKYVVKAPSGKKNTDDGEYFYEEDYPEFELRFSDTIAPTIAITYQKEQELTVGQSFTTPSPTITDNSYDGGHVIADETRIWHAYAGWKHINGLLKKDASDMLEEVEFDDEGKLKMDEAGTYYFVVFYQAEDNYNNKTIGFPEDAAQQRDLSGDKWSSAFWLIKLTVKEPEDQNANRALLITLIVLGSLSLVGIAALVFIKPIDEVNTARKSKV